MTFEQVLESLAKCDFTMERYEREGLDAYLSKHPLDYKVPSILIAGSEGKSLTAAFLASIYKAAGYKVASFIKPFDETLKGMQIDGKSIDEGAFADVYSSLVDGFDKFDLTSFERQVVTFLTLVKNGGVDIAVIECGMGGKDDATNIFDPVAAVLTSVSLEHTAFLGRSLSEIAYNKAAIFRKDTPAIVGQLDDETKALVRDLALQKKALYLPADVPHHEVVSLGGVDFDYGGYNGLHSVVSAGYAAVDAGLAIETVKSLLGEFPVTEEAIRKGVGEAVLPCRMEVVGRVIYDGGHSVDAITRLRDDVNALLGDRPYHVLYASYNDKNINTVLPTIGRDAASLTLTTFEHPRARNEMDYFLYLEDYPYEEDPGKALDDLLEQHPEDYVLVTGSLAFCYHLRRIHG